MNLIRVITSVRMNRFTNKRIIAAVTCLIMAGIFCCSCTGANEISETTSIESSESTVVQTVETVPAETEPTEPVMTAEDLCGMLVCDLASSLLNRDVTADEYSAEITGLAEGSTDIYTVVSDIVFGDEFTSQGLDNSEIISRLNTALARGTLGSITLEFLTNEADGGVTIDSIVDALTHQMTFEEYCISYGVICDTDEVVERSVIYDNLSALPELEDPMVLAFGGYVPGDESISSLEQVMEDFESTYRYQYSFLLVDINTGRGITYNYDQPFYLASSIKGPYAISLGRYDEDGVRTHVNTIINMLVNSDNDAYTSLNGRYGRTYIQQWCEECGVNPAPCAYKHPRLGCRDMARIWTHGYEYLNGEIILEDGSVAGFTNPVNPEESDEPLAVTLGSWLDHPEYSLIHSAVGEMYVTQSKGGWMVGEDSSYSSTVDAGIVYSDNGPYVVVIESNIPINFDILMPLMLELDSIHNEITA